MTENNKDPNNITPEYIREMILNGRMTELMAKMTSPSGSENVAIPHEVKKEEPTKAIAPSKPHNTKKSSKKIKKERAYNKGIILTAGIFVGALIALSGLFKKDVNLLSEKSDKDLLANNLTEKVINSPEESIEKTKKTYNIHASAHEITAKAPETIVKETFSKKKNGRFGYGKTRFDDKKYDVMFENKGGRESRDNYNESFLEGSGGGMAGGKYQTLLTTLAGWGYLKKLPENPLHKGDNKSKKIRKWFSSQDPTSKYITIYNSNDGEHQHFEWENKNNIGCAQDYYDNHNLQEYHVRYMADKNYNNFNNNFVNSPRFDKNRHGDVLVTVPIEYEPVYEIKNGRKTKNVIDSALVSEYCGKTIPISPCAATYGGHLSGWANFVGYFDKDNSNEYGCSLSAPNKRVLIEYIERGYNLENKIEKYKHKDNFEKQVTKIEEDKQLAQMDEKIKSIQGEKQIILSAPQDTSVNKILANGLKVDLN